MSSRQVAWSYGTSKCREYFFHHTKSSFSNSSLKVNQIQDVTYLSPFSSHPYFSLQRNHTQVWVNYPRFSRYSLLQKEVIQNFSTIGVRSKNCKTGRSSGAPSFLSKRKLLSPSWISRVSP